MNFMEMLGINATEPTTQPTQTGMNGIVEPVPQDMQGLQVPPKDEAEVMERVSLWEKIHQRVKSDKNLQRTMAMMGGYLMQPVAPGQTSLGHLGGALNYGMTAYDLGEQSQREAEQQALENARKERESQSAIERNTAETERTRALTQTEDASRESAVTKLKHEAEAAGLALKKAKRDDEVAEILSGYERTRAEILKGLPGETVRKSVMDELESKGVENALKRAIATKEGAEAEYYRRKGSGADVAMTAWQLFRMAAMQSDETIKDTAARELVTRVEAYRRGNKDKKGQELSEQVALEDLGIPLDEYAKAAARLKVKGAKGGEAEPKPEQKPAPGGGKAQPKVEKFDREGNPIGGAAKPPPEAAAPAQGAANLPKNTVVQQDSEYATRRQAVANAVAALDKAMNPAAAKNLLEQYGELLTPLEKAKLIPAASSVKNASPAEPKSVSNMPTSEPDIVRTAATNEDALIILDWYMKNQPGKVVRVDVIPDKPKGKK